MWKIIFLTLSILTSLAMSQETEKSAARIVRWCVPYDQPPAFANLCTKALEPANNDEMQFECVIGGSFEECFNKIRGGEAELTTVDGGDGYLAHNEFEIEPLLYENYGEETGTEYYAVAVVGNDFCDEDTTIDSLRDKRSCHTGYRKTAGWFMPLGTLLDTNTVEAVREDDTVEDDAETIHAFFSNVCAPRTSGNGPKNGENGSGVKWDELCQSCGGDCTTQDKYYDYQGAFRCLMEGAGDVAFVKHTTVPDFARDGSEAEWWATKDADEFKLLCKEGGCMDIAEYEDCHWARVPAHSVVAASSLTFGGSDYEFGQAIQNALITAVEEDREFLNQVIEIAEQENFLFKSSTVSLTAVTSSYEDSVGSGALGAYRGVTQLVES